MALLSRILLLALVAAPGTVLPNDIRCTDIDPGRDPRPRALAAETSIPAPIAGPGAPGRTGGGGGRSGFDEAFGRLNALMRSMPDTRQMSMATDSVKVAVELDREAKTTSMCRLQGGYGLIRRECAALLGSQGGLARGGAWVASAPKRCTPEITAAWSTSLDGIRRYIATGETSNGLLAEYIHAPAAFKASHGTAATQAVRQHVDDTGQLLDNCYMPAEESDYEKSHHVLHQMGKLIRDGEAVCTGLLLRNDYFLTARHCFEAVKNGQDLWFQPYQSADRYQVCAIAGLNALGEASFKDIDADQVLVRIARTSLRTAAVEIAAPASLMTVDDGAKGKLDAPTLLANLSYFPLAELIRKDRFKSGYVKDAAKYCAIATLDSGCFAHVCGAIPGGSGSPVFVYDAGTILLAGTHVGASNDRGGLECKAELGTVTNSAVIANALYAPAVFKQ